MYIALWIGFQATAWIVRHEASKTGLQRSHILFKTSLGATMQKLTELTIDIKKLIDIIIKYFACHFIPLHRKEFGITAAGEKQKILNHYHQVKVPILNKISDQELKTQVLRDAEDEYRQQISCCSDMLYEQILIQQAKRSYKLERKKYTKLEKRFMNTMKSTVSSDEQNNQERKASSRVLEVAATTFSRCINLIKYMIEMRERHLFERINSIVEQMKDDNCKDIHPRLWKVVCDLKNMLQQNEKHMIKHFETTHCEWNPNKDNMPNLMIDEYQELDKNQKWFYDNVINFDFENKQISTLTDETAEKVIYYHGTGPEVKQFENTEFVDARTNELRLYKFDNSCNKLHFIKKIAV